MNEQFQDWLLRYGYILKKRNSPKTKDNFLRSLMADLSTMRDDISVKEYETDSYDSKIVYVGDLKNADKVVVTYYDTPLSHFSEYEMFNRELQQKNMMNKIIVNIVIILLVGAIGLYLYMRFVKDPFNFKSVMTYVMFVIIAGYFYLLGKVSKGVSVKSTMVRNSSSIVYMLSMISKNKKGYAYAFVDNGVYGDAGINTVAQNANKKAKIFYLDSVGAKQEIRTRKINNIKYVFASQYEEATNRYFLDEKDLNLKEGLSDNYDKVVEVLK